MAARDNLITTLNNLPESSIVRDFILKNIDIGFELLANYSNGKLTINYSSNIQPWLNVKASNFSSTTGGTYRFLQTSDG